MVPVVIFNHSRNREAASRFSSFDWTILHGDLRAGDARGKAGEILEIENLAATKSNVLSGIKLRKGPRTVIHHPIANQCFSSSLAVVVQKKDNNSETTHSICNKRKAKHFAAATKFRVRAQSVLGEKNFLFGWLSRQIRMQENHLVEKGILKNWSTVFLRWMFTWNIGNYRKQDLIDSLVEKNGYNRKLHVERKWVVVFLFYGTLRNNKWNRFFCH